MRPTLLTTSVQETRFHREKFMRATSEGPMMLPMRVLKAALNGMLHDIRGQKHKRADIYSAKTYAHSQEFGRSLWNEGSNGIAYDSVRHIAGACVAIFKPSLLTRCHQERHCSMNGTGKKSFLMATRSNDGLKMATHAPAICARCHRQSHWSLRSKAAPKFL